MKTIKSQTPISDEIAECTVRLLAGSDGAVWQHEERWVYENPAATKPPQGKELFDRALAKMELLGY